MSVEEQRLSLLRLMEQLPERAQKLRDDSEALLGQANKLAVRVELLDAQANRLAYGLVGYATALSADMETLNAIAHSIGDLVDWPPAGVTREAPVLGQHGEVQSVAKEARLDVPWVSQLAQDANYARGDCGTAALTMWLHYLGHNVSVDDVSRATGLPTGFRFTAFDHLQRAANAWGLALMWVGRQSLDALRVELALDSPVIALVHYPSLPMPVRYDAHYPYSHWVTVVGYSAGGVIYHDPYFPPGDEDAGAFIEIANEDFLTAWGNNHQAGNRNSNYAMVVATR